MNYYTIKLLERLGLASQIEPPRHVRRAGKRAEEAPPSKYGRRAA